MPVIRYHRPFVALVVFSLFLASCQAVVSESGNIIEPAKVEQIHVGLTSRDDVLKLLGPPTLVNTFRQERWVYIQDRQFRNIQRTFSRVANRLEITFDEGGLVKDIKRNFNDTLYDPREVAKPSDERSYTKWLFGGEFSKPATDPKPEEVTKSTQGSDSIWSSWTGKDNATGSSKDDPPAKPADSKPESLKENADKQATESSTGITGGDLGKKEPLVGKSTAEESPASFPGLLDTRIKTKIMSPDGTVNSPGMLAVDPLEQNRIGPDAGKPDYRKEEPGSVEESAPRPVLQPEDAAPPKPIQAPSPAPPEKPAQADSNAPWWQFWSK
ncbi:MAG: outer membrane protein assembly factor BamE [Magnetococcales bacterium]|nr:outer membrane protein assembly factor BamE [Magnetococcales bacterium]